MDEFKYRYDGKKKVYLEAIVSGLRMFCHRTCSNTCGLCRVIRHARFGMIQLNNNYRSEYL